MPIEIGDSTATVRSKINAVLTDAGLNPADNVDTTAATNLLNQVAGLWDVPVEFVDRMPEAEFRESFALLEGGGVLSSFGRAKSKLASGQDATFLVIGDSTGNAPDEWVYRFFAEIGLQNPTARVAYRLYAGGQTSGSDAYDPEVAIQEGSGGPTIHIWNASVATTNPTYLLGAKKASAIDAVAPDCIIWNHGQNTVSPMPAHAQRDCFLMGFENVRLEHPGVPHVVMLQNPRRDDDLMASVIAELTALCAEYGDVTLIDGYSAYIAAGKPSGWYTDINHPNATGSGVLMDEALKVWSSASKAVREVAPAFLASSAVSFTPNWDFSNWTGAFPAGWGAQNSGTATKDTGIKYGADTYSARVEGAAAQAGMTTQGVTSLTPAQGKMVTMAVLLFVPLGSASGVGRHQLYEVAQNRFSYGGLIPQGGWVWSIISKFTFTSTAAAMRASISADTAANTSSKAYIARASTVEGSVPRGAA